jgi:hypothetical protein
MEIKTVFMNKLIHSLLLILMFTCLNEAFAQNNESLLVGRTYSKSASSTNKTILKFKNKSEGISESSAELLGRTTNVSMTFTYVIKGSKMTITYEDDMGVEDYVIDETKKQLTSTHLQGYVDGKWGKIYWKRVE